MTEEEKGKGVLRRGVLGFFASLPWAAEVLPDAVRLAEGNAVPSQPPTSARQALVGLGRLHKLNIAIGEQTEKRFFVSPNPFHFGERGGRDALNLALEAGNFDGLRAFETQLTEFYQCTVNELKAYDEGFRLFLAGKAELENDIKNIPILRNMLLNPSKAESIKAIDESCYKAAVKLEAEANTQLDKLQTRLGIPTREMLFELAQDYHLLSGYPVHPKQPEQIADLADRHLCWKIQETFSRFLGAMPQHVDHVGNLISEMFCQYNDAITIAVRGTPGDEQYNRLAGNDERVFYEDYKIQFPSLLRSVGTPTQQELQAKAYARRNATIPLHDLMLRNTEVNTQAPEMQERVPLMRGLSDDRLKAYAYSALKTATGHLLTPELERLWEQYRDKTPTDILGEIDEAMALFAKDLLEDKTGKVSEIALLEPPSDASIVSLEPDARERIPVERPWTERVEGKGPEGKEPPPPQPK